MFKNLNIKQKILSMSGSVFFIVFLAVILIVYFNVKGTLKKNINSEIDKVNENMLKLVESSVDETIKNYLKAVSKTNLDLVKNYYDKYEEGRVSQSRAKSQIRDLLLTQKIGKSGYNFVMRSSDDIMQIHPDQNLIGEKTPLRDEILAEKEGYFEYEYEGKQKVLNMVYFSEWDWVIATSAYRSDFKHLVDPGNFRKEILSIKLGETGYTYVINSKGTALIHPGSEGKNLYDAKDSDGNYFIREICNNKEGKIVYPWKNKGYNKAREKVVYYRYFPLMDWIVASGAYVSEAYAPLKALLRTLIIILVVSSTVFGVVLFYIAGNINKDIQKVISQFKELIDGIVKGKLDLRGDPDKVGIDFKEIMNNTNQLINAFVKPINVTAEYIDRIGKGDIPEKIDEDYKGDFKEIQNNFNLCIDSINGLIEEAKGITTEAVEGKLDNRGKAEKFQGDYKKIIAGMNNTLDAVVNPLNVAAEYIDRIGQGDIPEKITDEYKGDFNEIKNSINSAIDGLQGLVNSNRVLQKVAENDYTKKVEGEYQGVYAEVAAATNTVIDRLKHIQEIVANVAAGDLSDLEDLKGTGKRSENDEMIPSFIQMEESIQDLVNETGTLTNAATRGKLDTRGKVDKFEGEYAEIVKGINNTLDELIAPIQEAALVMGKIADKDMTARITNDYEGQLDEFKQDINTAANNLEEAMQQVKEAVEQVSSASDQVASGSQQLAEGSNEQASSLEEVSSTLEEMSSMVQQTSDNSNQANKLSAEARQSADDGSQSMEEMQKAINDIKESSDETSKIVKTIDDIAFQTNLLALNAAVEAARAGEAGKGFAVVAEEVRNLAQRSAEAAKNTSEMIQESIENAENGVEITMEMAEKLKGILTGVDKVNELVGEIDAATKEQAEGIDQVNTAVAEMNDVTQQNASNSEESASAAEELNSQAEELSGMIETFQLSQMGYKQLDSMNKQDKTSAGSNGENQSKKKSKKPKKTNSKEITPEDVIPLDEKELNDF